MRKINLLGVALTVGVYIAPIPADAFTATVVRPSDPHLKAHPVGYKKHGGWRWRHGWSSRRHSSWRVSVDPRPVEMSLSSIAATEEMSEADRRFMARFAEEDKETSLVALVLRRIGRLVSPQSEETDADLRPIESADVVAMGRFASKWVKKISPADAVAATVAISAAHPNIRDMASGWTASAMSQK